MVKKVNITIDINVARTMLGVAGFNLSDVKKMSDGEVFETVLSLIECYGAKTLPLTFEENESEHTLTMRYNEETKMWEKHDPYCTLDVMTESDYNTIKEAVSRFARPSAWRYYEQEESFVCEHCGASALNNYRGLSVNSGFCPHCGKIMSNSIREDGEETRTECCYK